VRKILDKIFGNSLVLAVIAIVLGVAVMALLFLVFDDTQPEPVTVSQPVGEEDKTQADGEIFPLQIKSIPAPFVSKDGAVLGYVFLDVTLEVAGDAARQQAAAALDNLKMDFTREISQTGVGMAAQPGVVDFDRLERVFLALAEEQIGNSRVVGVIVLATEEEQGIEP